VMQSPCGLGADRTEQCLIDEKTGSAHGPNRLDSWPRDWSGRPGRDDAFDLPEEAERATAKLVVGRAVGADELWWGHGFVSEESVHKYAGLAPIRRNASSIRRSRRRFPGRPGNSIRSLVISSDLGLFA
jgi:hypothetical protein